jgi:single-strand DNA-binding protein
MSFNQVILFGRLTADPDTKVTQNGQTVCNITLAVDRPKSKDGTQHTDFIHCNAWGKTAETIDKFFAKGKPMLIVGSLRDNNYADSNGVKHYSKVVLVHSVSFTLNDRSQSQNGDIGGSTVNVSRVAQMPQNGSATGFQGYAPLPCEDVENFEEILPDGEIPF